MIMYPQCSCLNAQIVYDPPKKKLIDFGWNSPFVREYRENMKLYESGPFDGLTIKAFSGGLQRKCFYG